ncbi:hypothetical protein HQ529_04200 [Candidatus Woesearchaeota archaeon]|nr:hypothetical protein [Candidatus Woesearchaeota archaeon]
MSDEVELGGNIGLTGFSDLDGSSMIVVKKIVGNYAKKFSEKCKKFERLTVTLKKVHEREKSEKYELHGRVMDGGKDYNAEITDRNLFFALDTVLKKLDKEIK